MKKSTIWLTSLCAALALSAPGQATTCNFGPYIVFFDLNDASITPETAATLDQTVSGYFNCGGDSIFLTGHTDSSGSAQYNQRLSQRRVAAVEAYLVQKGIPAAKISREAMGETRLRVPTPPETREPQNRRVEITGG